jgi:hypothetical protein
VIARHEQWQAEHEARMARIEQHLEATAAQQALNTQAIAHLTASILDLRNLVADHIQSRNQTE